MKQKSFLSILIIVMFSFENIFSYSKVNFKNHSYKKKLNNHSNKQNLLLEIAAQDKQFYKTESYQYNNGHSTNYGYYDQASNNKMNFKNPKYVEKLKYYEDTPSKQDIVADSNGKLQDTYYTPFSHKNLRSHVNSIYNCDLIPSLYECKLSTLCTWNVKLKSCGLNLYNYNFRQKLWKMHSLKE